MEQQNEKELNLDDIQEPEEVLDEDGTDLTDWKKLAFENHGRLKRTITDLKKYKEAESKAAEEAKKAEAERAKNKAAEPQDKKEFDLAEESYLMAKGIKESQFNMVLEEMKTSKLSLKQILESPYFKEKLETAVSLEATPAGNKRGGGGSKDEAGYWLAKGQYPPNTPENRELRSKVAAALAKQAESGSKFSSNPIA